MPATIPFEALPFFISAVLMTVLAGYSARQLHTQGSTWFAWVMLATTVWVLCEGIALSADTLEQKTLWQQLKYCGALPTTMLWLSLTLEMTGHRKVLRSIWFQALWLAPGLLLGVILTNEWHQLYWQERFLLPGVPAMQTRHGPAFFFYAGGMMVFGLTSLSLFVRHSWQATPFHRRRNLWLMAGLLAPYFGYAMHFGLFGGPWLPYVDHVPLMFLPTSIFLMVAIFHYRAMEILPLAERLVFENINSGVVVVDHQNEVVAMNNWARDFWQPEAEQGVGLASLVAETADRPPADGDEWILQTTRRDGSTVDLLVRVSRVGDQQAGLLGHALVFVDISERVAAERARSQFLASISHELRNPLHGTTGLIELALDSESDAGRLAYLQRARDASRVLLTLIDDVLDHGRLEAAQFEFERVAFDLNDVVNQLRADQAWSAAEKQIDFTVSADNLGTPVMGDPLRLAQVLTNLTANAIKFTEAGEVRVDIRLIEDRGAFVLLRFSVADTGIGIAADRIDSLFDAFVQADSSMTRRYGGAGLGLSIAQGLVRGMGSRIQVSSELGAGSQFSFELFLEVADALDPVPKGRAPAPDLGGANVLVVDDTAVNLEIVCAWLEETHAGVVPTRSGREALEAAAEQSFDLVLLDVHMPDLDGLETARSLRSSSAASIPIIAMTASASENDRRNALAAGMDGLIAKPFTREQLQGLVAGRLGTDTPPVPGEPDIQEPDDRAVIQAGAVEELFGGDQERYRELVSGLLTDVEMALAKLQQAADPPAFLDEFHGLKGAALLARTPALASACGALELALRERDATARRNAVAVTVAAIADLRAHLDQRTD